MSKETSFNEEWLNPQLNPDFADLIRKDKSNPKSATCVLCKKSVNLSNMGRGAVVSHSASTKHKTAAKMLKTMAPITNAIVATGTTLDHTPQPPADVVPHEAAPSLSIANPDHVTEAENFTTIWKPNKCHRC